MTYYGRADNWAEFEAIMRQVPDPEVESKIWQKAIGAFFAAVAGIVLVVSGAVVMVNVGWVTGIAMEIVGYALVLYATVSSSTVLFRGR